MTQKELFQALCTLGLPVAYSGFGSAVTPPFITYQFAYSSDLTADNHNYLDISHFQVELYSKTKDPGLEAQLQALLRDLRLAYRKSETFVATEGLFQVVYEVQLIGG